MTFPFIYRAESDTHPGGWLFFNTRNEHRMAPIYDYAMGSWVKILGIL